MCKAKEPQELSSLTHPPLNWITGVEIFSRQFEIFLKFIDGGLLFPAISSCETFLKRTYYRQGLGRWRRYR